MPQPFALTGASIVCLSSIDWTFLWQGHQEIASRFAGAGNQVFFVENTGVRTIRPNDLGRVLRRLRDSLAESHSGIRHPTHGVSVVSPLVLPFPRMHIARVINERLLLPKLAEHLHQLGTRDPVILTFLPTPNALRLIKLLRTPRSVVIYYCIADFQELSDLGAELDRSEAALTRAADLVFVQGEAFARRLAPLNPNIHEFRFGVNLELFERSRVHGPGRGLQHLSRPVIGYSGGLHRYVDYGLLVEVARAFPHGSVVLVGPLQTEPAPQLRAASNVHFLGARAIEELPALVATFDVALIPYARTVYTETVFPTKLYEYLAMGRPVVSTDLPEVRKTGLPTFAVRIAADSTSFVAAIRDALDEDDESARASRAALARTRDWNVIVGQMAELIAQRRT